MADANEMELEICELYFEAISKLLGKENRRQNIKQQRSYFNRFPTSTDASNGTKTKKSRERRLLRGTLCHRIAYIYRNSTCISSAAALHFENVLKKNANALKGLWQKNILRICSLGGGSPSDVVALVKVLETTMGARMSWDMNVTVVDVDENWKTTCVAVLQCLGRFRNQEWNINFIQADVSAFGDEVTAAIKEADIVSMVKFVSECQGGTKKKRMEFRKKLFQKVYGMVQSGSLLFLLDSPQNGLADLCGGDHGILPEGRILLDVPQNSHKLDPAVVDTQYRRYDKLFRGATFSTTLELFARAWLKSEHPSLDDGVFLEVLGEKHEEFRKILNKRRSRTSEESKHSGDASAKCWKLFFTTEMRKIGWNRKRVKRAIASAEREVSKRSKK